MKLTLGIVGLPNVGKSSLFNALTQNNVPSENYAFTTIEPNTGVVPVYDPRLSALTKLVKPKKEVPAVIEFVDIAGLVKGANKGEGLGNQFLANIREVSAIVQVLRAFDDSDVLHVEGSVNPVRDVEIINTELILKDIETVSNRISKTKQRDPDSQQQKAFLEELLEHLDGGARAATFDGIKNLTEQSDPIQQLMGELQLLSAKPQLYVVNVESDRAEKVLAELRSQPIFEGTEILAMDIKLEAEIMQVDESEREEFMQSFDMNVSGLQRLTQASYRLLNLISFFTAGEQEVRAWTIRAGISAQEAAGVIHTDFSKNFIAAEIVAFNEFIKDNRNWQGAKSAGVMHLEGRDYIMKDGDVVLFKVNA